MANNSVKTGGILAGAGCVFGLAPLAISFAAAAVGSDIGIALHWYTLVTAPVGAVIVIIGLVGALVGAARSTPEDLARSVLPVAEKSAAEIANSESVAHAETPLAPVALPGLPTVLSRMIKLAYAVGFGVVLVSCVMRVTLFQPMSGILTFFDLVPVFFAGWLVYFARKSSDGLGFLRLFQAQMIVSISGCVVGLYPLFYLSSSIELLGDPGSDNFLNGGTLITGLIPLAASVASLIFAGVVRALYRRGFASS